MDALLRLMDCVLLCLTLRRCEAFCVVVDLAFRASVDVFCYFSALFVIVLCLCCGRYQWDLFQTSSQITIDAFERQLYIDEPMFSRFNFNMTAYSEAHGLPLTPVASTYQGVSVDAYIAYTWA